MTFQQLLIHNDLTEQDLLSVVVSLARHHADGFAVQFLETIAARGLASGEALQELAGFYEADGRYKDARGMLDRALQSDRPSSQILFWLARVA
jgi:hypothetical protein